MRYTVFNCPNTEFVGLIKSISGLEFATGAGAGAQAAIKKAPNFSGRPADWNETVCEFIESIPDCAPYVEKFRPEHVNGAVLLELDKKDLKDFFEMPLGVAVNVCSHLKKYEENNKLEKYAFYICTYEL
ncbi:Hypothetical predicted protein [Mytilus galloprovincialis]|uniref:SAM domain-containing protein n=1 Tax=Mytilus galloprovincialis TaxID=29158 RepID=A0A8B6G5I0_MYTGA|nr:Hypothetical predicted protein [Mytilus galloprovincialis]